MEAYSEFAQVYDLFMDNIPYEEWCSYLETLLKKYGVEDGLVLDMGCGTGNITEALRRRGYDMIGIDNSEKCSRWLWRKGWHRRPVRRHCPRHYICARICVPLNFTER